MAFLAITHDPPLIYDQSVAKSLLCACFNYVDVIDDRLWISCAYFFSEAASFERFLCVPALLQRFERISKTLLCNMAYSSVASASSSLHKRLKLLLTWKDVLNLDRGGAVSFKRFPVPFYARTGGGKKMIL